VCRSRDLGGELYGLVLGEALKFISTCLTELERYQFVTDDYSNNRPKVGQFTLLGGFLFLASVTLMHHAS
jgi:hypothetical protein